MNTSVDPALFPPRDNKEELAANEQLLVRESINLLSRGLDPLLAAQHMLHLLSELLGLNSGRVAVPDPQSGDLVIRASYGLTREEVRKGRYAPGEGITGRVLHGGETLIVQDIDAEPGYLARAIDRARLPPGTVSFIALPIQVDRRIAGVLGVHRLRSRPRPLGADIQILRTISELIGQSFKIHDLIRQRTAELQAENRTLKAALRRRGEYSRNWGIIGEAPKLLAALNQLEQVASSEATVLLLGESGTGKELFARALHLQSARRDQPFVKVNCAAIPETLFEAELFGHEKGAYTGASQQRIGRFEQAHGGTLFLDEIGDLPLPVQVKLLRVLQERVIERLGGRAEIAVDVRIVAATHQDLGALVQAQRFRLDLYYRLNVIPIRLPALRERPGDIQLLVRHLLSQINERHQRDVRLTPDGLSSLVSYPWPGNVRQLYNVLERIVLLAPGDEVAESTVDYALVSEVQGAPHDALATTVERRRTQPPSSRPSAVRDYQHVTQDESERIRAALDQHRGNKSRTAKALDLTLRQLDYRLSVLGIEARRHKPAKL